MEEFPLKYPQILEKISTLASYSIHKSDVSDALSIWGHNERGKTSVKYTFTEVQHGLR